MASTPIESYQNALNYTLTDVSANIHSNAASFTQMLTKLNNSTYIYPTISIVLFTISNLLILFSKSIKLIFKLLVVLALFVYIGFTVYWFKK